MYIRTVSQKNKKTNKIYTTHRLVEAYRNAKGSIRQEVLLNLGCHFEFPKEQWKLLADRIEEICQGQNTFFQLEDSLEKEAQRIAKLVIQKRGQTERDRPQQLPKIAAQNTINKFNTILDSSISAQERIAQDLETQLAPDYQRVDVNSLEHQDIRKIGAEHVGYHAALQLQLDQILMRLGFNKKQSAIALATIIARLARPGSELATHGYLTQQSALDELLGVDFSNLPLSSLYRISDQLIEKQSAIEEQLYQREQELFQLENVITLFDITNTYFEGKCLSNAKAQYGRSKEKRTDCPLVALGMVLDASGFPKKSRIFPGNIGEPGTLKEMLGLLEGDEEITVVMDAGIATEKNLIWLKENGYEYIVVSRKKKYFLDESQEAVLVKEKEGNTVRSFLVKNEETDELELYCHSEAKEGKATGIISKAASRFENALEKLSLGLQKKSGVKNHEKILERLGRLKERYKRVAYFYEFSIKINEENKQVVQLTWEKKQESMNEKQKGIYCLRTNRKDLDEKTFWNIYTMLTELEAVFRSLKTELGFRPVYHQKEERVDGHLFISVLAYHLVHTIRYQLKQKGINASWETLRDILDTHCRITSTMLLEDGRALKIRKTSTPDTQQWMIYQALGIAAHPGETAKAYF